MSKFIPLTVDETFVTDGGVIPPQVFWTLVAAGFAGGIATGINRKARSRKIRRKFEEIKRRNTIVLEYNI